MARVSVLGVPIDALSTEEVLQQLYGYLRGDTQHHVMTPNNEMLVEADRNPAFKALLNRTSLNLADSTGVVWAMSRKNVLQRNTGVLQRNTGVDTVVALCSTLPADIPVFLLGAAEGVAHKASESLQKRNPNIVIAGTYSGDPSAESAPAIIDHINASGAKLLLVAYGAPQQDLWIDQHLSALPTVRVAIGVGGTFDFLAGIVSRAPEWMQYAGLEWLWRLMQQPSRYKRILTALVVFPWLVLREPVE